MRSRCSPGLRTRQRDISHATAHYLEYSVVHELLHLLERQHNDRFTARITRHLPRWRDLRAELNLAAGIVTFLFTGIEGSTRFARALLS